MGNSPYNRKEFVKKIGMALGSIASFNTVSAQDTDTEIVTLTDEQLDFLHDYEEWLKKFHIYVKIRINHPNDTVNNLKLMELSEEADRRKTILEMHMDDEVFQAAFNYITESISMDIE